MARFLSFAGILTYYGFKIWRFGLWLRLLEIDPARGSAPPGRAADCLPQGETPPPARLFSLRDLEQGFWDASTSAILCLFDAFWEPLGAILESLEPS